MASVLSDFIVAARQRSWELGSWDCMMAIADWVELRTGIDPAEPWRAAYRDEAGRAKLLKHHRLGFLGMMRAGARRSGLEAISAARRGDVGLVHVRAASGFARGRVAAIALAEGFWWTVGPEGQLVAREPFVRPVAIWAVP